MEAALADGEAEWKMFPPNPFVVSRVCQEPFSTLIAWEGKPIMDFHCSPELLCCNHCSFCTIIQHSPPPGPK